MKDSLIDDAYNCNYLFYSIIGPHAGESVESILTRKQKEIDKKRGIGLWAAKIDKNSKNLVQELKKTDRVFVLCKINKNAKDPTKEEKRAQKMITTDGNINIPPTIKATYGKGDKYQAYVYKEIQILDEVICFDFKKFESELGQKSPKGPITKSFKERFKSTYFQNTFGRRNNSLCEPCKKPIHVIMELGYPFVVDIE